MQKDKNMYECKLTIVSLDYELHHVLLFISSYDISHIPWVSSAIILLQVNIPGNPWASQKRNQTTLHTFHIPVLGLGYSIDTPVKVARFGINSVVSIIEDDLIERMRQFHSERTGKEYIPISTLEDDYRARRITAYLDLMHAIVAEQVSQLKQQRFDEESEIVEYFELLPDSSTAKQLYATMSGLADGIEKLRLQKKLRNMIIPGSIDVNIMSKVDNQRYDKNKNPLPAKYSDAMSALRGFANSGLSSSVVFSAGYSTKLYNYLEEFADFHPDPAGHLKKKIVIKVSDYRSAMLQGKILAKRGLWVSEFRIESGLNCGGHAFPTNGQLMGSILDEFKRNRDALRAELFELCKSNYNYPATPPQLVTVQGGIGTALEQKFLLEHYGVDRTGWGSPFLLVPEATNVDDTTLEQLANAQPSDYYLSHASPLGVPFNNFRPSSSEEQRNERIEKGRPGSPCYKKYLASNTEFTERPICTASRLYQKLKLNQLDRSGNVTNEQEKRILEKDCLCEGLVAPALIKNNLPLSHNLSAVTICPGPNLAYFSGIFSLRQMVGHIYGRNNLLNSVERPNFFISELRMYIDQLTKQVGESISPTAQQVKHLTSFKRNLCSGISYYSDLLTRMTNWSETYLQLMRAQLNKFSNELRSLKISAEMDLC